jgi:hypothetical protein
MEMADATTTTAKDWMALNGLKSNRTTAQRT